MMYKNKAKSVTEVIENYFHGIFYGDVEKLQNCFTPNAYLYGDVKGAEYVKSLEDYLEGIKLRQSPDNLNEENRMEILSLDILGHIAVAKLHVPMLGFNYYDFIALSIVDGEWKIVNKLFTHIS